MGLLLDRPRLAEALGVSESAIGAWELKGLPVVRKGRGRGMRSLYDFDQVRKWCDDTGHGKGLQAALARRRRTPSPARPGASVCTELDSSPEAELRRTSDVLARTLERALVPWAALLLARYPKLSADEALNAIEDGLLVVNEAAAAELGIRDPEGNWVMLVPDAFDAAERPAILESIERAAAEIRHDSGFTH